MPRRQPVDPIPDHQKFGYASVVEKRAIRDRLIAAGRDPDALGFLFEVEAEYEIAHKNDLSMRERQEIARARNWKPRTDGSMSFTQAELDYMAYKLDGVNDPDGYSALAKIKAALGGLETQERPTVSEETRRRAALAGIAID